MVMVLVVVIVPKLRRAGCDQVCFVFLESSGVDYGDGADFYVGGGVCDIGGFCGVGGGDVGSV